MTLMYNDAGVAQYIAICEYLHVSLNQLKLNTVDVWVSCYHCPDRELEVLCPARSTIVGATDRTSKTYFADPGREALWSPSVPLTKCRRA